MPPKVKKKKKVKSSQTSSPQPKAASSLKLREVLDISYAERFRKELMEYFEKSAKQGVQLDASSVNRITTPCVQILLSLAKSCGLAKVNFKLSSPSEAFTRAFSDLGLTNELTSWSN